MTLWTMTWRPSLSTGTCWAWRPHCGEEACVAPGSVAGEGRSWGGEAGLRLHIRPGLFLPVTPAPGEGHAGLRGYRSPGSLPPPCPALG